MKVIHPPKLKQGDEIRVIAPARSMSLLSKDTIQKAINRLQDFGLIVSFGDNVYEVDEFMSSSIESRIQDLHTAFTDKHIKGILSVVGGYNSNQLLEHIDYEIIKSNPKILCGFSDITTLSNAIFAKTGLIGYSGPHFSSRGIQYGFDYSIEYFEKCCFLDTTYDILPSSERSDDPWYLDQENRLFEKNEGYTSISQGASKGRIIGGHLPCLSALLGSQYFPSIDQDIILFIEQDEEFAPQIFDRLLQHFLHTPHAQYLQGIVIGRSQRKNNINNDMLAKIIQTKKQLNNLPIIANVNFGHTMPFCTFPIGGYAKIQSGNSNTISILEH